MLGLLFEVSCLRRVARCCLASITRLNVGEVEKRVFILFVVLSLVVLRCFSSKTRCSISWWRSADSELDSPISGLKLEKAFS